MRGPRIRARSDGDSAFEVGVGFEDGDCGVGEMIGVKAVGTGTTALRRRDRFDDRRGGCSSFTSARKRAIVSVPTATSTVASSSRIRRSDAPFCRSSMMPSFIGMSFACRFGDGVVNARAASLKRCVRAAMSVRSLILLAGVQREVGFGSMATG